MILEILVKHNFHCLAFLCLTAVFASTISSANAQESVDYDKKIGELGFELPPASKSVGIYKRAVVVDKMVYLSGHISIDKNGNIMTGKVGGDISLEQASTLR